MPLLKVSEKAANLIGSEIIRLGGEINQKIKEGNKIYNLTIGDFNPSLFPIPNLLKEEIIKAYRANETNYPPADGMAELRKSVSNLLKKYEGLDYPIDQILIAGGGRPLIYAAYQTLLDKNDKVLYPVPSWNNNHYCHLSDAQKIEIETNPENGFMPTADELAPYIKEATILALCSPLNPTGTTFGKEQLSQICKLVLDENKRRGTMQKPIYVLYDQIYWMLTTDGVQHYNPVGLFPEMEPYTIFVDGISKSLAATGVRVGWGFGPADVISKMKSILGHIGAWSPKAEQVATTHFLNNNTALELYLNELKQKVNTRFNLIYNGINQLKKDGFPVNIIAPQGAIYLSVQFLLRGYQLPNGHAINTTDDITSHLLNTAQLAIVPFTAFGCNSKTDWYRISVGTIAVDEIPTMLDKLKTALQQLVKTAEYITE
jgi:aspartate aminotransferase